ncbi:MAG: hypothetical protein WCO42_09940 [bacterium]
MNPALREKLWAWRWPLCVAVITGIGLVIRVCMAWAMRYSAYNGDFSIIGLMARHMAEGADYPVFAYGVAYMGSLEPALAAMLARLFHIDVSVFVVNLSPSLVGTLLLPLLYLFGRDAGSRRAGVLAMLFCLVGSDTLLHHSVAPRGGYMNLMVGGLLALWLSCRIATGEGRGEPISRWIYLVMGLAAGVAWWTTELAVVFLLAASMVLVAGFRWRMVRTGLIPALVGFLLGSLPWLAWNITHQWGSLDFCDSMGKAPFLLGISRFWELFQWLVEMSPGISWFGATRFIVFLGLISLFLGLLIRDRIRKEQNDRFFFRMAAVFLFVSMVAVYCTSSFVRVNATRYLLPVFPAVAIMVAVACDRILQRFRIPWGLLAFILVIPPHILLLPKMFDGVAADRAKWEVAAQLETKVAPLCDGNFAGDFYLTHWINFASHEKLCVAALPLERRADYARRVELAERRAYLNGYGNLPAFLAGTRSSSHQRSFGEFWVDYGLTPPSNKWRYLDPQDVLSVRDQQGGDCTKVLVDSIMDTTWATLPTVASPGILSVTFARPVRVRGIRLFSLNNLYPRRISIEGRKGSDSPWRILLPPVETTACFWSGSYVMLDGCQYLQEFRLESPEGGITEVRLVFPVPRDTQERVKLGELLFMEADETGAGKPGEGWESAGISATIVASCAEALHREGLTRFYAPRWLAERLYVATSNSVSTLIPSLFTRTLPEMAQMDSKNPYSLVFSQNTGLFMDARDVPRSREILQRAELTWREVPLGAITLLVIPADRLSLTGAVYPRAFWTEHGCFGVEHSKVKAQVLYESAIKQTGEANRQSRLEALRQAVDNYPMHYPAREALVSALMLEGALPEANSNAAVLRAMTQPTVLGHVRFHNGVELLGLTVGTNGTLAGNPVKRGETIPITYYWKCPANVDPDRWEAFVHIKTKDFLFQNDHVLLSEIQDTTLQYQPFSEIFIEHRSVTIPDLAVPGEYQIWIGLVERTNHKRVPGDTALPVKKNAVQLPVRILVK